jgi:hypothetical protein
MFTTFFRRLFGSKKESSHPLDGSVRATTERAMTPYISSTPETVPMTPTPVAPVQQNETTIKSSSWDGFPKSPVSTTESSQSKVVKTVASMAPAKNTTKKPRTTKKSSAVVSAPTVTAELPKKRRTPKK